MSDTSLIISTKENCSKCDLKAEFSATEFGLNVTHYFCTQHFIKFCTYMLAMAIKLQEKTKQQ